MGMNNMNGHSPLAPSNQYCAFCNTPMFIKTCTDVSCPHPKPEYFTNEDWASEMQVAMEVSNED